MTWRKIVVKVLIGLAATLAAAPVMASESDVAQRSSGSGLPRLEFETPPALPPRPVVVPGTLRGVMGYRLPLVSRQEVPGQVVSGVLIPAHTTYVILQPGRWEPVGLSSAEVEALRAAAKADEPAVHAESPARGWNPLRLFRRLSGK